MAYIFTKLLYFSLKETSLLLSFHPSLRPWCGGEELGGEVRGKKGSESGQGGGGLGVGGGWGRGAGGGGRGVNVDWGLLRLSCSGIPPGGLTPPGTCSPTCPTSYPPPPPLGYTRDLILGTRDLILGRLCTQH